MDSRISDRTFQTIDNGKINTITRRIDESMNSFIKRMEMYIKCRNCMDEEKSTTMSIVYSNKLKYGVTYIDTIESDINSKIVC